jgi:hypothetical protein
VGTNEKGGEKQQNMIKKGRCHDSEQQKFHQKTKAGSMRYRLGNQKDKKIVEHMYIKNEYQQHLF